MAGRHAHQFAEETEERRASDPTRVGRFRARSVRRLPRFADRLPLGPHLRVSPFCVGMVPDAALIPAAFDAGINFFFLSADRHWPLYESSRRGIRDLLARGNDVRDQIVIAAASYLKQPSLPPFAELLSAQPELERLDIVVAAGASAADVMAGSSTIGELGPPDTSLGASFHDRGDALMAVNHGLVDIAFIRYSPADCGARSDLFPYLSDDRSGRLYNVESNSTVPQGRTSRLGLGDSYWRQRWTDHYRYALSSAVDGILFSPTAPRRICELADALEQGPLDDEEQQHLENMSLLDRPE